MVCTDLDELIEPIAAGEIVPDADARAHLASCAACAHALELARQIDGVLAAQPVPDSAPAFTPTLMGRLRRERWRSEQYLDVAFNIAVGLAVATTVGGLVMVLAASGLGVGERRPHRVVRLGCRGGAFGGHACAARLRRGGRRVRERHGDLVVGRARVRDLKPPAPPRRPLLKWAGGKRQLLAHFNTSTPNG